MQRLTQIGKQALAVMADFAGAIWVYDNTVRPIPTPVPDVRAGQQAWVEAGDEVGVNPVVKNVGDTAGTIFVRTVKKDTGEVIMTLTRVMLPEEGSVQFGLSGGTMPETPYNLAVEIGHVDGANYIVDRTFSFTVLPVGWTPPPEFPWWILGLLATAGIVLVVVSGKGG